MAYIDINGETQTPDPSRYVPNPPLNIPALPTAPSGGNYGIPGAPGFDEGSHPSGVAQVPSGGGSNDNLEQSIRDQYQRMFGRAPQGNELATDMYAASRYGLTNPNGPTGGVLGQIAARANNTPGSGVTGNPFAGWSNPNDPRTATSQPAPTGTGWQASPWQSGSGLNYPGSQFNDPYTNLLEQIAKRQIDSLTGENPQTKQLMDFINKRFGELSTSPGYTPDQMAVLNTQALEPIEALRKASQQRELERTSRAGYLPTSGITLDQQRQIDTSSDQARTAANRDLSINAINRQDQQRNQAVQLGQLGMQIPQQQNAQALDVANILYQLPRQAMLDANTIVNGSSPQSVISPYIQLMQQQQQAQLFQQAQQQQFWDSIGANLAQIFGGG